MSGSESKRKGERKKSSSAAEILAVIDNDGNIIPLSDDLFHLLVIAPYDKPPQDAIGRDTYPPYVIRVNFSDSLVYVGPSAAANEAKIADELINKFPGRDIEFFRGIFQTLNAKDILHLKSRFPELYTPEVLPDKILAEIERGLKRKAESKEAKAQAAKRAEFLLEVKRVTPSSARLMEGLAAIGIMELPEGVVISSDQKDFAETFLKKAAVFIGEALNNSSFNKYLTLINASFESQAINQAERNFLILELRRQVIAPMVEAIKPKIDKYKKGEGAGVPPISQYAVRSFGSLIGPHALSAAVLKEELKKDEIDQAKREAYLQRLFNIFLEKAAEEFGPLSDINYSQYIAFLDACSQNRVIEGRYEYPWLRGMLDKKFANEVGNSNQFKALRIMRPHLALNVRGYVYKMIDQLGGHEPVNVRPLTLGERGGYLAMIDDALHEGGYITSELHGALKAEFCRQIIGGGLRAAGNNIQAVAAIIFQQFPAPPYEHEITYYREIVYYLQQIGLLNLSNDEIINLEKIINTEFTTGLQDKYNALLRGGSSERETDFDSIADAIKKADAARANYYGVAQSMVAGLNLFRHADTTLAGYFERFPKTVELVTAVSKMVIFNLQTLPPHLAGSLKRQFRQTDSGYYPAVFAVAKGLNSEAGIKDFVREFLQRERQDLSRGIFPLEFYLEKIDDAIDHGDILKETGDALKSELFLQLLGIGVGSQSDFFADFKRIDDAIKSGIILKEGAVGLRNEVCKSLLPTELGKYDISPVVKTLLQSFPRPEAEGSGKYDPSFYIDLVKGFELEKEQEELLTAALVQRFLLDSGYYLEAMQQILAGKVTIEEFLESERYVLGKVSPLQFYFDQIDLAIKLQTITPEQGQQLKGRFLSQLNLLGDLSDPAKLIEVVLTNFPTPEDDPQAFYRGKLTELKSISGVNINVDSVARELMDSLNTYFLSICNKNPELLAMSEGIEGWNFREVLKEQNTREEGFLRFAYDMTDDFGHYIPEHYLPVLAAMFRREFMRAVENKREEVEKKHEEGKVEAKQEEAAAAAEAIVTPHNP